MKRHPFRPTETTTVRQPRRPDFRPCFLGLALAAVAVALPARGARADVPLDGIKVTYHGGALIQHLKVAPLFYGASWQKRAAPAYLQGFLKALFEDGRFMANLAQYHTAQLPIGNGSAMAPVLDPADLPKAVTDDQIRAEIKAQIAAGKLPSADADTLYVVCTPPEVVVVANGGDSRNNFDGYHDFDAEGGFAYALVALTDRLGSEVGPAMTLTTSHELAEGVTDPQPSLQQNLQGGWYDEQLGEIGDIPVSLYADGFIDADDVAERLTGADGTQYLVQKVWSNQDQAPVAFAPAGSATVAAAKARPNRGGGGGLAVRVRGRKLSVFPRP